MRVLFLLAGLLFAVSSAAGDIIVIESRITGSEEQPRVISVVPWQQPRQASFFEQDIEDLGLAVDVFQPLERESFNRELRYISATRN